MSPAPTPTPLAVSPYFVDYSEVVPLSIGSYSVMQGQSTYITWHCGTVGLGLPCPTGDTYTWHSDPVSGSNGIALQFTPPSTTAGNATSEYFAPSLSTPPGAYSYGTYFTTSNGTSSIQVLVTINVVGQTVLSAAQKTAIYNLAVQWELNANDDSGYGAPCVNACVVSVNNLVHAAIGKWLGSSTVNNVDALRANGSIVQLKYQSQAVRGDLMIVDSANRKEGHVGVCLNIGCTNVISNSGSAYPHCTFTFESDNNARFNYNGSPYAVGATATYWSIK